MIYFVAGWRWSDHAVADVVLIYVSAVAYALYRIYRLPLPAVRLFWWTGGLLLAAPFALPLLYRTLLVKADR